MPLSDPDRAYIHEAAVNAARETAQTIIEDVMKWHIKSCPHGIDIIKAKWALLGGCAASAAGGGSIAAMVMHFFGG